MDGLSDEASLATVVGDEDADFATPLAGVTESEGEGDETGVEEGRVVHQRQGGREVTECARAVLVGDAGEDGETGWVHFTSP